MHWRPKPFTIISILMSAAILFAERGLDMAGVTLSLGWAIALWVIAGFLFLFAVAFAIKSYLDIKGTQYIRPLTNRDLILRAMANLQETSIKLLNIQEEVDNYESQYPYLVNSELMTDRENAANNYHDSLNKINEEALVSGGCVQDFLYELNGFVSTQVRMKIDKPVIVGGAQQQQRILSALEYSS